MSIRDLQRAIAEVGRIRIGYQAPARGGKTRPAKLETFRLTSPDQRRIQQAAALYGGTPRPWTPEGRPKQWEVYTTADQINVIVPPSDMALTQDYEHWLAGGCQRRCDGAWEQLSDRPCLCDPLVEAGEARLCKIHSRLWVMLAEMPGLGLWRLETSGWYAARELLGSVDVIKLAAGRGAVLPARLLLEQRQIKRADETVKKFAVPRLDPELTPNQLFAYATAPALEAPRCLAVDSPGATEVVDASASIADTPERFPRTCDEAGDRCLGKCTVDQRTGRIRDPDCFREPALPNPGPRPPEPRPAPPQPEVHSETPVAKRKRGNITPVPDGSDPPSIREQINSPSRYKRRTIDAPTSGLLPRTAASASRSTETPTDPGRYQQPPAGPNLQVYDTPGPEPDDAEDYPLPNEPPPEDGADSRNYDPDAVTTPQLKKLAILRKAEHYDDTDDGRAQWFAWLSSPAAIGREVTSNKNLTKREASDVIDLLEKAQAQDQKKENR